MIADYRMAAIESGNAIIDYSGSGNNANLASNCTSGTSPTRVSGTGGLSFTGSNCFNLPAALNNARTILVSLSLQPSAQTHSYISPLMGKGNGAASNSNGLMVICGTNSGGGGLPNCAYKSISNGAQANGTNSTVGGTVVLAVAFGSAGDSTTDHLYIDGVEAAYPGSTTQSAGLQTVGNFVVGGTATGNGFNTVDSGTWFVGTEYRIVMYSRFLSASEVAAASAVLQQDLAARGVTTFGEFSTSATDSWMALGDSITAGAGTLTAPWPSQVTLNGTWAPVFNNATGGNTASSIATSCTNGQLNSLYSPLANRSLVVIFAGTNDVNGGKTPAQAWNSLASCGAALKKASYQTMVVTMLSRTSNDANKNSLDTLIRANAVPTYFIAIADAAEVVSLGADGASGGSCFQDGIHPTQGCSTNYLVPVIQRTMNSLYACQNFSCATTYASGAPAGTADTAESESGNTLTFTSTLNPGVGSTVVCTGATPAGYNSPTGGWLVLTSSGSNFTAYSDTSGLGAGTVHATCSVPQEKDTDGVVILNHNGSHTLESAVGNYCRTFHAGNGNTPTLVSWGSETINTAATLAMTSNETIVACPQLVSASAAGANWVTVSK
jgi:lysophospholipase L1-like esterase